MNLQTQSNGNMDRPPDLALLPPAANPELSDVVKDTWEATAVSDGSWSFLAAGDSMAAELWLPELELIDGPQAAKTVFRTGKAGPFASDTPPEREAADLPADLFVVTDFSSDSKLEEADQSLSCYLESLTPEQLGQAADLLADLARKTHGKAIERARDAVQDYHRALFKTDLYGNLVAGEKEALERAQDEKEAAQLRSWLVDHERKLAEARISEVTQKHQWESAKRLLDFSDALRRASFQFRGQLPGQTALPDRSKSQGTGIPDSGSGYLDSATLPS